MNKKCPLLAVLMLASTVSSWGSGFQVAEQGASNIGTALAGSATNANNDASAAYWNPSAAFFTDGDMKLDISGTIIRPSFDFRGTAYYPNGQQVQGSMGGNAGEVAYVPNLFFVKKINEEWLFSFVMTSPYGLVTEYDDDFVGRLHGIKSDLMTVEFNPSIAYKPLDWLTFSIGASANYVNADLTSTSYTGYPAPFSEAFTRVNGHSWSGSFNVGVTVKFLETGRFGVAYRYSTDHTLSGSLYTTNPLTNAVSSTPISCDLTLPSNLNVGVYYRFTCEPLKSFALMADYAFTQWSSFDKLEFKPLGAQGTTKENWKDTSRISFGIHYYPEFIENLVVRIGGAWDESPVRNATYRTPRVPDSNRWWVSGGIGYKFWDRFNIDIAYTYLLFNDTDIDNSVEPYKGNMSGYYKGHAHMLSMQFGMKW